MTTASDLLNQNTGVPPTSPWATITGETAFNLGTSYAEPSNGSSDAGMYYSTLVGANQFSRALVVDYGANTTPSGGAGIGVAVRMSTSAETQIRAVINAAATNNVALQQLKAGVFTQLAVATMAFVKGTDFIELDVTGAKATVIKNATPITGLINIAFDATIASGSPGIAYSSDSGPARVSTWSGGDLGASVPVFSNADHTARTFWKGVYTDFAPPNLLADKVLKLPPFTQAENPGWPIRVRGNYTDFAPSNLLAQQTLRLPPLPPVDLSQRLQMRWSGADQPTSILSAVVFSPYLPIDIGGNVFKRRGMADAPPGNLTLSTLLPTAVAPLTPQDLSLPFKARWAASDFITQNLLTNQTLKLPPLVPVDATITIRAKGVFTDFSPPNLALSTLAPVSAIRPQDISGIRLEYRWVRGDALIPNLNLSTLAAAAVTPLLPQDISGSRLDARGLRSDFVPPNLTLTLPVPPPVPPSAAAGRHGTRKEARRRRQLDVLRAKVNAFKEQRLEADQALMRLEDGEIRARAKLLKRVKVKPLTKPLQEYAPVKNLIAQRTVVMARHRSILEQIRAHQLEAERIQREIENERDEEAALHLFHYLMMETSWHE